MLDGLFNKSERVDVFNLGALAEGLLPKRPYGHIGITAHTAFRQVAVADPNVAHQGMHLPKVRGRLLRGSHIWLGHDL